MPKLFLVIFSIFLFPALISAQPKQYLDSLVNAMNLQKDTVKVLTMNKIIAYYGNQGIFDSADIYSSQILKLSENIGYQRGICIAYNSFGVPQMVNSQYPKALEYFFKSLSVAEKNNLHVDAMIASRNIAAVYILQEEFKLAIPLLRKVLDRVVSMKDSVKIFPVLTDIGFCHDRLENKDSARYFYEEGISICDLLGKKQLPVEAAGNYYQARARVFEKTSQYYLYNGRPREALRLLLSLWEEVKDSPDLYTKVATLNSISLSYQKIGKIDSVLYYSSLLINFEEAQNFPDGLAGAYSLMADALYKIGKYKEAYESQVKAGVFKDSVFNSEKYKATHELQTRYETAKKEDQIINLNREKKNQRIILAVAIVAGLIALGLLLIAIRANRLQKKLFIKEKEVQKAELEKRMFELQQTALRAQMNPHFIFNCLNSVQRFVGKDEKNEVNHYLTTFASLIRQTLDNSGKQLISLKDELEYLETYIKVEQMRSRDSFDYDIQVDENIDLNEVLIPNMLIQPFVENSIKHGLNSGGEKRGKLKLAVSRESKLIFVVEDNGPGIKDMAGQPAISKPGHQSMGSSLTEKRIDLYNSLHNEKINFTVSDKSVTDKMEQGTRVMLEFPVETE